MSCAQWQLEIALYAGGDLPAPQAELVERHLFECFACARLCEEFRADRDALAAMPVEQIEPDYADMRRCIRQVIVRKRWVGRAVGGILAGGALAAAALLLLLTRSPQPAVHPVAKLAEAGHTAITASAEPPAPAQVRHTRIRRPRKASPGIQPHVAMYIATRNPNVTILLLQAKREISDE